MLSLFPFMQRVQWKTQEDSKTQAKLTDGRILRSRMAVWNKTHANLGQWCENSVFTVLSHQNLWVVCSSSYTPYPD